jgi:serine/threonine protein kinase
MNNYSSFSALEFGNFGDIEHFQKILLKRSVLSETMINYFTRQILEALEYIHRCKIVHMDIKQRNILINSELNIKLTDFSTSCYYGSFNAGDIVKFPLVGTRKYMSPEIIERTHMKIKEAEKIDIYSLGVTLYNLAFDTFPYKLGNVKDKDYDDVLKKIKNEKLDFPREFKVSEIFKDFLRGLLDKNYNKRFNIKKALNHPFINGSKIIFDEKEKISDNESFLIKLITDNISKFNEYIKNAKIISYEVNN